MELFRLYAYSVSPSRTVSVGANPPGGSITITDQVQTILSQSTISAKFESRTLVDFDMDARTRSNAVRDRILTFGFQTGGAVDNASVEIAKGLADAMDRRSTPCLLFLTAMREDDRRCVTIWTFPRDQAFRLLNTRGQSTIQVLTDVFSQKSSLRKAAKFEGRQLRNEFLQGRVLDFQAANQLSQQVADFWIGRFLHCRLSISADAGTRMLAGTIRTAVDACKDDIDKVQILTAMMAVRTSPQSRWSLDSFADQFLSGTAKRQFIAAAPDPGSRASIFDFVLQEFDAALAFRIFTLDTGVLVSSPLKEIGASVQVSGERDRRLSCEGRIVTEKVRSRHA